MINKLFENAGKKLQILAKKLFCIVGIGGTIVSIIVFAMDDDTLILIPIMLLVGWVGNLILFAFGELCESIGNIRKKYLRDDRRYREAFP